MKTILAFLALAALGFAAEPVVRITDTGNVYIDDSNAGQPADVIANHPHIAPLVQKALVAYVAKTAADAQASIAAANKAKEDAIAGHTAAKAAEIADLKAQIEAKAAELAAQTETTAKRVADLSAALAAKDAELATVRAELAAVSGVPTAPTPEPANP
jgi:ATP/maltotriose-dependent transcriptional regulator MalT